MSFAVWRQSLAPVLTLVLAAFAASEARADSLEGALIQAYQDNPTLNSQRAATRAIDENVATALAGYRPKVNAQFSSGEQFSQAVTAGGVTTPTTSCTPPNVTTPTAVCGTSTTQAGVPQYISSSAFFNLSTVGATATQTIFNGFQTGNRTRQAEAQVLAARETLRAQEQATLLNAVTAYMNLLRDGAILELQKSNVQVLEVQLRQTRDRFNVGEVTRTDVAQAESRLAAGQAQMQQAQGNYVASVAAYRQMIGVEPGKLAPGMPVDRFLPHSQQAAVDAGRADHPNVTTATYNIDAAELQVKIAEGALYPTLTLNGSVSKQWGSAASLSILEATSASVIGQLSVPLYQGGAEYAAVRQAKETLGQRRMDLDSARELIQFTVLQAWGALDAAKAELDSTQAQVRAAEIALNGVREEARVGQRTTLDVLNAQQELVNARVSLVTAQRDRVVASYTTLAAVGRLSPQVLGLRVTTYDPITHYTQVRDNWFGLRTPDGR